MNNYRSFLSLGILVLVFAFIVAGIPSKVFAISLPYITYNGSNLYISPTDNSDGIVWDPGSEPYTSITGAQSDTDGFGNTAAIVTALGAGSYAAQVCSDLNLGGYTDWYLPAIDQLQAIHDNTINPEDGFTPLVDEWYWSSTELTPEFSVHFSIGETPPETYARIVRFNLAGPSDIYTKSSNSVPVRCVRSVLDYEITVGTMTTVSGDTTSVVNIDATPVEAGATVTLTVVPEDGMRLEADTLVATYNGTQTATLTNTDTNTYTFIMPAYAVTVTATFEVIPSVVHHTTSSGSYLPGYRSSATTPTVTASATPVSTIQTFTFLNNLKSGMSHSDIKELQKFLNINGFPLETTGLGSKGFETDYFGKLTKQAVAKFQLANGLVDDGMVGPLTRAVLNK